MMKQSLTALLTIFLLCSVAFTQVASKHGYRLIQDGEPPDPVERLLSNSVIDMVPGNGGVFMGTGGGVSFVDVVAAGNDFTYNWQSFDERHGLGEGSVSALDFKDDVLWAATAYSVSVPEGILPAGGGVGFSTDFGSSWTWFDQPVDPAEGYDTTLISQPTTTNIQNVTYDLAITSTDVWITSFGGGLRRYSFADSAWHIVTPDSSKFDAADYLNHRAFAVTADDDEIWVGTAAGVNKSTDNGATWENFNSGNDGLSGNFVTALGRQIYNNNDILWAATWQAESPTEYYGVSKTENGGLTWEVALTSENEILKAHNFAFDDSIVYVATNLGLYKSVDLGETWDIFPDIIDFNSGDQLYDPEFFSALTNAGMLWVGTGDGVASSPDYGNTWTLHRSYLPTSEGGQPATYAYPNPYSPRLHPVIRFQYDMTKAGSVTLKIFDFALDEVTTVVQDKSRNAGDYYEVWTGKRSNGDPVATGVYYYRVERSGMDPEWGKFAVIY